MAGHCKLPRGWAEQASPWLGTANFPVAGHCKLPRGWAQQPSPWLGTASFPVAGHCKLPRGCAEQASPWLGTASFPVAGQSKLPRGWAQQASPWLDTASFPVAGHCKLPRGCAEQASPWLGTASFPVARHCKLPRGWGTWIKMRTGHSMGGLSRSRVNKKKQQRTPGSAAPVGTMQWPRLQREAVGPQTSWEGIGHMVEANASRMSKMRLGQLSLISSQHMGDTSTRPGVPLAVGIWTLKPYFPNATLRRAG